MLIFCFRNVTGCPENPEGGTGGVTEERQRFSLRTVDSVEIPSPRGR